MTGVVCIVVLVGGLALYGAALGLWWLVNPRFREKVRADWERRAELDREIASRIPLHPRDGLDAADR